jgi:nickel/cobalt exporter
MPSPILIESFVLGVQHSFEPDHVAAVSVLTSEKVSKAKLRKVMWKSSQWALGHSFTLILLSIGALLLKSALPASISTVAEWAVGPMMVWIGISSLRLAFRKNLPPVTPALSAEKKSSVVPRSLGIGMLHGIAGTGGACTVALTMAADDSYTALWIIIYQSIGILLTMTAYGYLLSLSFSHMMKRSRFFFRYVISGTGVFSIAIGLWLLVEQALGLL